MAVKNRTARFKTAEREAEALLEECTVRKAPVPVEEIARQLNIRINYEPFDGPEDVSAVLRRTGDRATIGVNSAHTTNRQRFSLAHELGHFRLHNKALYIDFGSKAALRTVHFRDSRSSLGSHTEEVEANTFAACLLMPKQWVADSFDDLLISNPDVTAEDGIRRLARRYQVSEKAMENRLLNLHLLIQVDD